MAGNHLESLVAEWYEHLGYFVRRNVQVGKRPRGGHECELDIVALHPEQRLLVHVEPSLDTDSWAKRETRYRKKFEAGRKYIPGLFKGLKPPRHIDQIALLVYGGGSRERIGGGRIVFIHEFMSDIREALRAKALRSAAVPEELPLLRTLQFAVEFWSRDEEPPRPERPRLASSE